MTLGRLSTKIITENHTDLLPFSGHFEISLIFADSSNTQLLLELWALRTPGHLFSRDTGDSYPDPGAGSLMLSVTLDILQTILGTQLSKYSVYSVSCGNTWPHYTATPHSVCTLYTLQTAAPAD